MVEFQKLLAGGDLRSIGDANTIVTDIHLQSDFDQLFRCLYHTDRLVVMRAADIIEKVTFNDQKFLNAYKEQLLDLCKTALLKELKWHLALLLPRLKMNSDESIEAWNILKAWATDRSNSRLVRVNSLQGLLEFVNKEVGSAKEFNQLLASLETENIPPVNARIRKIRKQMKNQILI